MLLSFVKEIPPRKNKRKTLLFLNRILICNPLQNKTKQNKSSHLKERKKKYEEKEKLYDFEFRFESNLTGKDPNLY